MIFKTEVNPGEYSDPLALHLSRIFAEDDEQDEQDDSPQKSLVCPYCGKVANSQEFIDEEMERTIKAAATSQIVEPVIDAFMNDLAKSFKGINSEFLKVSVTSSSAPRQMLAFSGPEVSDMRRVSLLCCSEKVKIVDGWTDSIRCPHCSSALLLT
jgi:hypothetical protein